MIALTMAYLELGDSQQAEAWLNASKRSEEDYRFHDEARQLMGPDTAAGRTILIEHNKAFIQTGGGIVADSDPQAEWDETGTKAAALVAGINAVNEF